MKSLGDNRTSDEMFSHICDQLVNEFAGTFSPETIQRFVSELFDSPSVPLIAEAVSKG